MNFINLIKNIVVDEFNENNNNKIRQFINEFYRFIDDKKV